MDQTNGSPSTSPVTHEREAAPSYGRGVQEALRDPSRALQRAIPEVYRGYTQLNAAVFADGALEGRIKELIGLAVAVSKQCDGCMADHARRAARRGATEDEVAETLGVAIAMNGGPGTVHGPRAFAAYREFAAVLRRPETLPAPPGTL
jgi:AhpD family alkylhydroperoxidase